MTLKEKLSWTFSSDSSLSRAEGGGSLQARRTEFTRMTHVFLASTLFLAAATCSLRCGAAEPAGDTTVFVGEFISIEGKPRTKGTEVINQTSRLLPHPSPACPSA